MKIFIAAIVVILGQPETETHYLEFSDVVIEPDLHILNYYVAFDLKTYLAFSMRTYRLPIFGWL